MIPKAVQFTVLARYIDTGRDGRNFFVSIARNPAERDSKNTDVREEEIEKEGYVKEKEIKITIREGRETVKQLEHR